MGLKCHPPLRDARGLNELVNCAFLHPTLLLKMPGSFRGGVNHLRMAHTKWGERSKKQDQGWRGEARTRQKRVLTRLAGASTERPVLWSVLSAQGPGDKEPPVCWGSSATQTGGRDFLQVLMKAAGMGDPPPRNRPYGSRGTVSHNHRKVSLRARAGRQGAAEACPSLGCPQPSPASLRPHGPFLSHTSPPSGTCARETVPKQQHFRTSRSQARRAQVKPG